jgi:peptidoglycan/LPS O-acetylase OafA/YrhL
MFPARSGSGSPEQPAPEQPPAPLRVAAALVAAEGAAAAVAAVGFAVAAVTGHPADRGTALTLAALLLVLGAGMLLAARGLWRQRGAAATPAYLAQFFTLIVAWYQRHTLLAVTIGLGLVAIGTVVALAAPGSRAALRRDRAG